MAIEEADVGRVAIKGVRVGRNIDKFIDGFQVAEFAEAGNLKKAADIAGKSEKFSSASEATQWGDAAQASAIAAVADTLINNVGLEKETAKAGSAAINTAYLLYACVYMGPYGVAVAAVGAFLSWAGLSVFGREPPRVYWKGKVNIFFNEKYPYQFSVDVKTINQETVGDISNDVEKEFNEKALNKIDKALKKLPNKDTDFVLKYVIRPPKTMTMDVDAGRATGNVEERFGKKIGQEMERIVKEIQKSAIELSHLHFLAAMKSKDLVRKKAIDQVPQMKYKVEGAWRKEEERLAIKLMQRREYTRQIKMMLYAYFFYGIRKGNNFNGRISVEKPSKPDDHTKKNYIEEGKSYVVGNIPSIKLLSSSAETWFKKQWEEHHALSVGGAKIKAKFRIRPKLRNKQIVLELYHIKDHIKIPLNVSTEAAPDELTWEFSNSLKKALKETIKFTNHLIGEIPTGAAKYIANELGTTDAYMNILWGCFDIHTEFIPGSYGVTRRHKADCHDFTIESNYPAQLNGQMQDIIDHYKFWQEGYAEDFKKRERTKILNNMLPQIREGLRSQVTNLANTHADMPKAEAISGLAMKTMKEIKQEYKNTKNNIPKIKKNKSWIINHFGQEEYNKILDQAQSHKQDLIMQYINNAGDIASQEMFNKKVNFLTITQTELDNLINKTYSKFKAKHPDISISKDKIRQKIKQKVNIKEKVPEKKPAPPKEKPAPPEEKPAPPEEKPAELPGQKILSRIPSAEEIPNWFENLSNPAKISIIGGGVGILALLLLSGSESGY